MDVRKPQLLVVDDDRTIRRLLARIAERAGFDVDVARDGAEALEKLASRQYMIAIVDLMMPRVSGYELVQKIGAMQPHPVVIVATAMANGDLASLDDTMVRRVIRKPFDIQAVATALVETAREIADRHQAAEQGFVVPSDSTVVATDATIKVDNVILVADRAAVVSNDVTIKPLPEVSAASDPVAIDPSLPLADEPVVPPPDDPLAAPPKTK